MSKSKLTQFISLLILAVAIRLIISWSWVEVADTANYRRVAETLAQGGQLYRDTAGLYPYPPPWAGVEIGALWLSQHTEVPFLVWVELLPILADVGIACLIYRTTSALSTPSVWLAATYALNPLSIIVTSMHGQFDALMIFFLMLSYYLFEVKHQHYLAAASLMVAVAAKSIPIIMLPLFLARLSSTRSKIVFASITMVPVAIMLLPFLVTDSSSVVRELFGYRGFADHGWLAAAVQSFLLWVGHLPTNLVNFSLGLSPVAFVLFYFLYLALERSRLARGLESSLAFSITTVFLGFYVFYPGLSTQYLVWVLPFMILSAPRAAVGYTVLAVNATLAFYSFRWPEIIYRAEVPVAPETTLRALYIFGTAAWWLGCSWLLGRNVVAAFKNAKEARPTYG